MTLYFISWWNFAHVAQTCSKFQIVYHNMMSDPIFQLTSTNVIGRLARTEFFYHFSIFLFNRFIWIKQIQLKSTINSNSSMNSLGFLNEFREISQWIHSDSSINSLGFLNKFTWIPQHIHMDSSMKSLGLFNEFTRFPQ